MRCRESGSRDQCSGKRATPLVSLLVWLLLLWSLLVDVVEASWTARGLPHELGLLLAWLRLGHELWSEGHLDAWLVRVTYLGHHVWHSWVLLQRHEMQVASQSLLICEKSLHSFLVLGDESRLREAILLVLN